MQVRWKYSILHCGMLELCTSEAPEKRRTLRLKHLMASSMWNLDSGAAHPQKVDSSVNSTATKSRQPASRRCFAVLTAKDGDGGGVISIARLDMPFVDDVADDGSECGDGQSRRTRLPGRAIADVALLKLSYSRFRVLRLMSRSWRSLLRDLRK